MKAQQTYKEIEDESSFFVIFPTILLERISARQCIIMGILIGHSKKMGYCFASNEYLAEMLRISIDSLQRDLRSLEDQKLIRRDLLIVNGQTRRRLYPLTANLHPSPSQESGAVVSDLPSMGLQNCDPDKDRNNNQIEIGKKIDEFRASLENLFPQIWAYYGKVGNRKSAHQKWLKLNQDEFKKIMGHLPQYLEAHRKADKMKFLPHLTTYLNQKRWEDEIPYQQNEDKLSKIQNVNWG